MLTKRFPLICFCILALLSVNVPVVRAQEAAAVIYYVSSSSGNDSNNGHSEAAPFKTIQKVNGLNLHAGDSVLFKCGDTWRGQMLTITKSGAAGMPITFGSYPAACTNKPIFSGAQAVSGWALHSGNIYVATLNGGANAGKFGFGVNQLFRSGTRLTLGRWPNVGTADGGYSTIDGMPTSTQITDNQLPAGNWTGAVAHIRGMRWYILNRRVTATSGKTLTLGAWGDCWDGNCTGWGYFINNHLGTLDSSGEWFYDSATHKLYLYSTSGAPANGEVEGSVIYKNDDRSWGGVTLGEDLAGQGISYVTVQNLEIRRWFRNGIATPTNFANFEPHHITLKSNRISDVDSAGINLAAWVYSASDGRPDGWRGGYGMNVSSNTIVRANSMGINLYSRNSAFTFNIIQDIGMIANLGAAGMGCAFDASGGSCTEDGDGIRVKIDRPADSGNNNQVNNNRLTRIAYNGIDVFGHTNTFKNNVINQACFAKGDCGAIRTFGRDNLGASPVHDLMIDGNIILNTIGNTNGCRSEFDAQFGFGLYIDNFSRAVGIKNNTIMNSTVHGILLQNSIGSVAWNTLYNNARTYAYAAQISLVGDATILTNHANNVLYGLNPNAYTLVHASGTGIGSSDNNAFFSPYDSKQILSYGSEKTLAQWKADTTWDANSIENWFSLAAGAPPNSKIFYNTANVVKIIDLGATNYQDLEQNPVSGTLTLQPFRSKVLVIVP